MPKLATNSPVGLSALLTLNDGYLQVFTEPDVTTIPATSVTYTPTDPADWPDPDPTNAQQALDSLATQVSSMSTPTADLVGYTPSTPADWGVVDPTQVANALDQLADTTRAGQEANAGVVGPADPITFTTANVTPKASGKFLVWGHVSADASGASTQVIDLLVDGATVIATGKAGTGGAGPFNCTLFAFVALDNTVTHTFAIRADASAGTNTANAGWMKLMWHEIGG